MDVDKHKHDIYVYLMKTISMVDFRLHSESVVRQLRNGEPFVLTYRGHPLAKLLPLSKKTNVEQDDPFYRLYESADPKLKPISNEEIDSLIYGQP